MQNQQKPEMIELNCDNFGGHAEHWKILTKTPEHDIGAWLHQALDAASFPFGLCQTEQDLPQDVWLLEGPENKTERHQIKVSQIIAVEQNKPKHLKTAFPILQSPYQCSAKITRILHCASTQEAVLRVELADQSVIYGYDTLYPVNQAQYLADTAYQIEISAWAYALEAVPNKETMLIEDAAAIRHHRALNDILAENGGETPDHLQERLAAWQPKSPEDELPVTLDISKMVAYLYGEHIGQEDEAWFQGDIVGKSNTEFMGQAFTLYDVAIMREEKSKPVILRLAYADQSQQFEIGNYIRGNLWIQFKIYDKTDKV